MDVDVYQVPLAADGARLGAAQAMLAADELDRFGRMVSPWRERCILARASLRLLLGRRFGMRPRDIALSHEVNGKPYLERAGSRFTGFNVAHSAALAVIALGQSCPLGIDLEFMDADTDYCALACYLFSEREQEIFDSLPVERQRSAFYRAWTMKEAFVKATGEGLARPLPTFEVGFDQEAAPRLLTVPAEWASTAWTIKPLPTGPEYRGALVAGCREVTIRWCEVPELC